VTLPLRVRAPATTANLGPAFDCAGVALELWNELEVAEGDGAPEAGHLGVRAFALVAPPDGLRFNFTDRIPRARGLGSSAAVIALGLVAGTIVAGREPDPEELLAQGLPLEGHGDNLAAALAGGVCLTWDTRIARIADGVPAVPIVVVPESTVETAAARRALPDSVPHADAAFTAGRAALLGAALAAGSPELLRDAFADRLHEPYRARTAPLLEAVRERLPAAALGATLSGSGPSVVVWAESGAAGECEAELAAAFPAERILQLAVSPAGAGPVLEGTTSIERPGG
jgi:homoserine kinase